MNEVKFKDIVFYGIIMYGDFDMPYTKVVVAGQGDIHDILKKFLCCGVKYKFDSKDNTFRIKNPLDENKVYENLLNHLKCNGFKPIHINEIKLTDGYYNSIEEYEADFLEEEK